MAGLGRTRIGLPTQLVAAFSFDRKFAICLSSSTTSNGVIFFGDGPYNFLPNIDASQSLRTTRLFINPVSTAASSTQDEPSAEYFIGVSSIRVNNKSIPVNSSLLSIDREGNGGTKISTVNPYTVLETSIYNALTSAYINEATAMNITRVASVAPFNLCFSTANVLSTRVGPAVPSIELVLQNENVVWMITGSNSMVQVNDNVLSWDRERRINSEDVGRHWRVPTREQSYSIRSSYFNPRVQLDTLRQADYLCQLQPYVECLIFIWIIYVFIKTPFTLGRDYIVYLYKYTN